jgi:hypothetical protein
VVSYHIAHSFLYRQNVKQRDQWEEINQQDLKEFSRKYGISQGRFGWGRELRVLDKVFVSLY